MSQAAYSDILKSTTIRGKLAEDASVIMHEPNVRDIGKFLFVMSFAMMASQSGTYMNVCTKFFEEKYGWDTQSKQDLNDALMNTIPAIGTICGSGAASKLMAKGRAIGLVIACIVGIAGSALTFISNWPVFLVAKFIIGASIGLTGVIVARYIEEYVPLKWFGTSQAISLAFLQAGIFLSTIIGAALPPDEEPEELKETDSWYAIFAVQPVMLIITIILFYALVRTDTPRFYITQG